MKRRAKKYMKGECNSETIRTPCQKQLSRNAIPFLIGFFIVALIVIASIFFMCYAPKNALAAPSHIEGVCYIECTNPEIDGTEGGNTFAVFFPQYGIETTGYCISGPLYGTPVPGHYPFTGTRTQNGSYEITIDCADATMYPNHYSPLGAQNIGNFTIELFGNIKLLKQGPEGYSNAVSDATLANARYEVRDSNGELCAVMTTDENGQAVAYDIAIGIYTLREIEPSFGYGLDEKSHVFVVSGGTTVQVKSEEAALYGAIGIKKSSSYPTIIHDNPSYSLKGAVYGVFDDSVCKNEIQRITTDASGYGQCEALLWPGSYWIKELEAPQGYALDKQVYPTILSVEDCSCKTIPCISVFDTPQLAPVDIVVEKIDHEKGNAQAQGDATLAGAVFSVEHYAATDISYDEIQKENLEPTFSDTVVTDMQGIAHIAPEILPRTDNGSGFPLGTVVIREITPPEGYMLPEHNVFICPITSGGSLPLDGVFHAPIVANRVIRGDIALIKTGNGEGTTGEQNPKQPLANIAFNIIHEKSKKTVARIITDENGFATTASPTNGDNTATLPFGTYLVQEDPTTTPAGYRPAPAFSVTIAENNRIYPYSVENTTGTLVRVIKQDAETGKRITGRMTFRILDENGKPLSFNVPEISAQPLTTFATDETGTCTLPRTINGGATYYLQEIKPPYGYTLNNELIPFCLATSVANNPDGVLEVVIQNKPQTGRIKLRKTDAETGVPITQANITWDIQATCDIVTGDGTVRAHAGEVVAHLVSNDDGIAYIDNLYPGSYAITETRAPFGYICPSEAICIELPYGDPSLTCIEKDIAIKNHRAKGLIELQKTNRENGTSVCGAVYAIRAAGDNFAPDGSILFHAGEIADILITDDTGHACSKVLPLGIYNIAEIQAPEGYLCDTDTHRVEIAYQGQTIACVKETLAVNDQPLPVLPSDTPIAKTGDRAQNIPFILSAQGSLLLCAFSLYRWIRIKKFKSGTS